MTCSRRSEGNGIVPDTPKFVIAGVEYEVPSTFRLTDPILVEELTGLEFEEFGRRLDEVNQSIGTDDPVSDYKATLGLVACAVWQKNPRWSRAKVARFLEGVDIASLDITAPEASEGDPLDSQTTNSPTPGSGTFDGSTTTPEELPEGGPV